MNRELVNTNIFSSQNDQSKDHEQSRESAHFQGENNKRTSDNLDHLQPYGFKVRQVQDRYRMSRN